MKILFFAGDLSTDMTRLLIKYVTAFGTTGYFGHSTECSLANQNQQFLFYVHLFSSARHLGAFPPCTPQRKSLHRIFSARRGEKNPSSHSKSLKSQPCQGRSVDLDLILGGTWGVKLISQQQQV